MAQKADYYEALTWRALEQIHGADAVRYEPAREMHTCADRCPFAFRCDKPRVHPRLIHTVPDFHVSRGRPLFVHVFHGDSRETSHAKFWRTVSEIAELKCFVPNCRCLCVIFETVYCRGRYAGAGWYPEFLTALHALADRAVFFTVPHLKEDLQRVAELHGTAAIHAEIESNPAAYPAAASLTQAIRAARHPAPAPRSATARMWEQERALCGRLTPYRHRDHAGERLRDALLQTVLLMLLFDWPPPLALDRVRALALASRERFVDRDRIIDAMSRLPIRRQGGGFCFLAKNAGQPIGQPMQCEPSDDLRWLIRALARKEFPTSRPLLESGLARIAAAFAASEQAREAIACLREALTSSVQPRWRSSAEWVTAYERVDPTRRYNPAAELLIAAIGLGTYPLIHAYNLRHPDSPMDRTLLRGLYGNRRTAGTAQRRRQTIERLAALLPDPVDWENVQTAYLLRKAKRIVGPQSAINPVEILARAVLAGRPLPEGFSLVENRVLPTFAADLVPSRQLGTWRVALALQSTSEVIPLFISAMRDSRDCAHKVREFAGHLRLARHGWDGQQLRPTRIERGIAVLEGGYSEDDKRALHLAGYAIASLDTLPEVVAACGLPESGGRQTWPTTGFVSDG